MQDKTSSNLATTSQIIGGEVCTPEHHVYPKIYAGDPQYANEFFSHCLCGKKRKITTVKEVDL